MRMLVNSLSRFFYQRNLGILLIRVATGLIFLTHGWMKVQNIAGAEEMFAHMGFGAGMGMFIAWLELIGGAALILGVLTRVFAVAFGIEMLVAAFITGSIMRGVGLELYLALVCFGIALIGSGRFSLYRMECRHCGAMLCNGSDCVKN